MRRTKQAKPVFILTVLTMIAGMSINGRYMSQSVQAQDLNNQQAQQELFTNNYTPWEQANPPKNTSNAPGAANTITLATANMLRGQWMPGTSGNSWNYTYNNGYKLKNSVVRWVTQSVSGGGQVKDFHARWVAHDGKPYTFLWHFKIK